MNQRDNLKKFISTQGYKRNSPDKNRPMNVIPSNTITMEDVDFPVYGVDNTGHEKMMYPGEEYTFPGDYVIEKPMMQEGGPVQLTPTQEYYAEQMYKKYGKVVLTDKGTNKTIYGTKKPDGTWDLNAFEVLTGTSGKNINNQAITDKTEHQYDVNPNYKTTPIGMFPLAYNPNIYGMPGYNLVGTDIVGGNTMGGAAYHQTYKGADDPNRSKLYNNNNIEDNYRSYGCINCEKPSIQALTKFLGPNNKGMAMVIDSRLTPEQNDEWLKKNTPRYHIPYEGVKGKGPDTDTDQNKFDENLYKIQVELNAKGANIATDGLYGPETEKAMAKYGSGQSFDNPVFNFKSLGIKPIPASNISFEQSKQIKEESISHDQPLIEVPDIMGTNEVFTASDKITSGDRFVINENLKRFISVSDNTQPDIKETPAPVTTTQEKKSEPIVTSEKSKGLVKGGTKSVQNYQKMLNEKYGANLSEDGAWGKNTQAAYEKYVLNSKKSTTYQTGGVTSHMLENLPVNNFNKGLAYANSLGNPNSMMWALPNQGIFGKMKGVIGAAAGLSGAAMGYEKMFTGETKQDPLNWNRPQMMQVDPRFEQRGYDFQYPGENQIAIAEDGGELYSMQFAGAVPSNSPVILPQKENNIIPFKEWYIQNAVRVQSLNQQDAQELWKIETGQQSTPDASLAAAPAATLAVNNESADDSKNKQKRFNTGDPYGMVAANNALAGLGMMNQVLGAQDNQKQYNKMLRETGTTDNRYMTVNPQNPFGNYTPNAGMGSNFQLITNTPIQDFGTRMFKEGGEYILSDEEIQHILKNGGTIEFID